MSVYQFEVSVENHTKGEIYNFCRQFDLPGSVISNQLGNIILEIAGEDIKLNICVNDILVYLKNDKLIAKKEIKKLTFAGSTFLIG